jgi:hypothetical protein
MTPAQQRQAAYRAAMVERKHGPFRTRLSAPTKPRDVGGRTRRPPVTIECTVEDCTWTGTARAWRPARVVRDAHRAAKHRKAAVG